MRRSTIFLQEKKIAKKDFVKNLFLLEPKLKITGEHKADRVVSVYVLTPSFLA